MSSVSGCDSGSKECSEFSLVACVEWLLFFLVILFKCHSARKHQAPCSTGASWLSVTRESTHGGNS